MRTMAIGCLATLVPLAIATVAGQDSREPLRGIVYDAADKPARGATVWAAKLDYQNRVLQRRETTADAQGRYALDLEAGSWYVWGRLDSQGGEGPGLHESVQVAVGRTPAPVTIRLEERGTFRGRLLEAETGKPIAGGQFFLDAGLVLTTDANGRFELGGLRRSDHEGFVVAPGRLRQRVLFDTTARADTELEVPVLRGVKIVGRVTDQDGKPVPVAYVGRSGSGSYFSMNALYTACAADGTFEYDGVMPDQPTWLSAGAPGFVSDERENLTVTAEGKPLEVHFRLRKKLPGDGPNAGRTADEKRRVISGVVRGPNAKPVSGVLVRWGYQPFVGAIESRTDAEGRFRLTTPESAGMLAVLPRELAPEFPRIAAGGDRTIDVALQAGRSVRGQVIDDSGKPIHHVQVIAVTASPDPGIANPYWLSESSVRTNAQGRFEMKGVPAAARFDFLKPGLSDVRGFMIDFDNDNAVTMAYGGALKGRVVDRDGKPIRNFRVLVGFPREPRAGDHTEGFFAGYSGMGVRFTSADGSFVLTGVGAGSVYRIKAVAPGHGEAVVERMLAVPLNHLEKTEATTLRASLPVPLRVRALAADGKPIASARVTLVNGEPGLDQSFAWGYHNASWEDMVRGRTDADGWADFKALSFGGATVLVQAPGFARQRLGWRDGRQALTIDMAKEAVIAGSIRAAAGAPVRAAYVHLKSVLGDQISATIGPDDLGRFRIAELPAGGWTVSVRDADGRTTLHQEQVLLSAGATKEMTIDAKNAVPNNPK